MHGIINLIFRRDVTKILGTVTLIMVVMAGLFKNMLN